MSFREFLQRNIDQVNTAAFKDELLKNAFKEYEGKRIVLSILSDATYTIMISPECLTLTMDAVADPQDMFVEMDSNVLKELIEGKINILKLTSMTISGKIRIRNISGRDISIFKSLLRGF
jgi:hypothetical protein